MSINGHVEGADKQGRKSRVADQQTDLEDEQATPTGAQSEAGHEAGIHRAREGCVRVEQSRKTGREGEGARM